MINCAPPLSESVLSLIDQDIMLRPGHYSVIKQTTVYFINHWCYCYTSIESGSRGSLVVHLGIGDITDLHHISGTLPVSKHRLHNLCKNDIYLTAKET